MIINLSPCVSNAQLELERRGETLIINGEVFDFSVMKDGDSLPSSAIKSSFFLIDVKKYNGELEFTMLLPIPEIYSHEQAFPKPLTDIRDGVVILPQGLTETDNALDVGRSTL
ncbi:hypothetical protein [Pseudomonas graminis]|uniref:hypothetical protein n=1 Tax=Pseudomonas graminis TaxID=158627 RepID=UPI0009429E12|nr:hypothetical protein [Pseudomonas graminis]